MGTLNINTDLARRILSDFIREEIRRVGRQRAVVGLSGGIDSAVSCYLAAEALGPQNVLAVRMPYRTSSLRRSRSNTRCRSSPSSATAPSATTFCTCETGERDRVTR
ncbi:MAG: hypothetical protein NZM11_04715 [Anaerolineales bacterium]|nr:hypothetical protein [Anaerolineales bacterium]